MLGLSTNTAFLRALLTDPDVVAGRLDTGLIERRGDALTAPEPPPPHVYAAAALACCWRPSPPAPSSTRWDVPDGWRLGEPAWTVRRLQAPGGEPVTVRRARPVLGGGGPGRGRRAAGRPRVTGTATG